MLPEEEAMKEVNNNTDDVATNNSHVPVIPRPAPAVNPGPRIPNPFDAWEGVRVGVAREPEGQVRTEFITGSAGTGKTYEVQRRRAADPEGVVLAATTGIAAVNLGPEVTTVHSLLKFFDYNSLLDAHTDGKLQHNIRKLVDAGMHELVLDEISMFSGPAMDILYAACNEVAQANDHSVALTVVGDFCQLPPIVDRDPQGRDIPETAKFAFEADCWRPTFSDHTKRLTRIWRQDNEEFVHALQAARRGAGEEALAHLQALGVRFEQRLSDAFEGTTLCANNVAVDRHNRRRLFQLPGDNNRVPVAVSTRWSLDGRQPSEWRLIPHEFPFKTGAYVMILSNDRPALNWANGDCGTVVGQHDRQLIVRLKRNNRDVLIGKITRTFTTRERPTGVADADVIAVSNKEEYDDMVRANGEPPRQVVLLREPRPTWIIGWVTYYPLRLAYATTVHKSQGLSLDTIQLDLTPGFLAQPAMMYVALSRCRTPGKLVLVGSPEQVVAKTKVDPRVVEWL
jgi:ATP-dependent DNA helicase PIF1